jgi:hypothetical protein
VRWVLIVLLGAACAGQPAAPPAADQIFDSICARCHGAQGHGGPGADGGQGPGNFHDHTFQRARTDAQLRAVIQSGKNNAVPSFGNAFSPTVLDGLVKRIRSYDPRPETP